MAIVICKLPRAGLGNQLFPLMKAYTFGQLNDLPVIVQNYNQFKIGPYLRGERSKRRYVDYFKFEKKLLSRLIASIREKKFERLPRENEPIVEKLRSIPAEKVFEFGAIPHWSNFFEGLSEHRDLVLNLFEQIVKPAIMARVDALDRPVIGVHIRMGDFRKLNPGEDFSKVGAVRTPEKYFIDMITNIRAAKGSCLPVSVFTDGHRHEFSELFSLPGISMVEGNPDLVDLILLSRSSVIVGSAGSTFSYWAAFLSQSPFIMHPDHVHSRLRDDTNLYEGAWDQNNALLVNAVKKIA